jgi:Kef-type K+ transport system membrane component KefB
MEFILQLLMILLLAKVFGEVIERSGFPSVLGEISAGVFLGMFFFGPDSEVLSSFAELGAIFLLFTAGYKEVNLKELRAASKIAFISNLCDVTSGCVKSHKKTSLL